jgi:hypothetical protein
MKIFRVMFAVLLVLPMWDSTAMAEFQLTPGFSLRLEYNDNLYLDSTDEESDFITTVHPSLNLGWETRFVDLSLDLGLDFKKYLDHSEEDDISASQNQAARFDSTWSMYSDIFFLRISDVYSRVPIDEGDSGGIDNTLTNLTDSNRFIVNPYLQLQPLRTLQMKLDYQYENIWYREEDGDDADNHRASLSLTQELSPRISAIFYGGYTLYRPKDPSRSPLDIDSAEEYDRTDARLTLVWKMTDYLTLSANAGQSWLDYEYTRDTDTALFGGQADYQLTRTLSFGASYQEDISDSVDEGSLKSKKCAFYGAYNDRAKVSLTLFQNREDYLEIQRQDDSRGATLAGDLPITNKYGIGCQLNYTDYEKADSEDYQRYGARIDFYRQLRIGQLGLGYTWNRNDSNLETSDYINNIVFAQLTFRW